MSKSSAALHLKLTSRGALQFSTQEFSNLPRKCIGQPCHVQARAEALEALSESKSAAPSPGHAGLRRRPGGRRGRPGELRGDGGDDGDAGLEMGRLVPAAGGGRPGPPRRRPQACCSSLAIFLPPFEYNLCSKVRRLGGGGQRPI